MNDTPDITQQPWYTAPYPYQSDNAPDYFIENESEDDE